MWIKRVRFFFISLNSDKALFTSYVIKFSVSSTFEYISNRMKGTKLTVNAIHTPREQERKRARRETRRTLVTLWHIAHKVIQTSDAAFHCIRSHFQYFIFWGFYLSIACACAPSLLTYHRQISFMYTDLFLVYW